MAAVRLGGAAAQRGRELSPVGGQVVAVGSRQQPLHPPIPAHGAQLRLRLIQGAAGDGERLLQVLHLAHELRDRGDVDHRELGVGRGRGQGEHGDEEAQTVLE
jgi:hypothetical protein